MHKTPPKSSSSRRACHIGAALALLTPGLAPAAEITEGALTMLAIVGPEYLGSRETTHTFRPGFFLRWGRVTLSSSGGFAASRRQGDVRGLGIDITQGDEFDLGVSLRVDGGRGEEDSPALAGMGDIDRTIRVRVAGEWKFAKDWKLIGGWTIDAAGQGGGNIADLTVRREWTVGRYSLTVGSTLMIGGTLYMQTWFGVNPEQSVRSGYPVYSPGAGLRDLAVYASAKADIGEHWVALLSVGYTRILGPAADSPLTQSRNQVGMTLGGGYRF